MRQTEAGNSHIHTVDANGGKALAVTVGTGLSDAWAPAWSPDAERVCFVGHGDTYSHPYLIGADGADLQQLTDGEADDDFPAWLQERNPS